MNGSSEIDAQVTLPMELYQAIAQRAQAHGHSVNREIVALLTPLLMQIPNELKLEFAAWEAASDEDWLSTEGMLASLEE
ncbi:Arc family DNA-binding protein [Fortiea sp. LEGE XX443]|uniref:Arc family DNA-binding protein n=1 Tax=Fortiea sp. LEGE XX443 TaxID=1828611 RepID=UPI0018801E03|nr:Arc family DNA-binding protein [Fortiea sp. LEGE XX443]MBE9003524.1 Arc family DNA-binding protein [Fortiea sp. LEGE XX443]